MNWWLNRNNLCKWLKVLPVSQLVQYKTTKDIIATFKPTTKYNNIQNASQQKLVQLWRTNTVTKHQGWSWTPAAETAIMSIICLSSRRVLILWFSLSKRWRVQLVKKKVLWGSRDFTRFNQMTCIWIQTRTVILTATSNHNTHCKILNHPKMLTASQ